MSLPQECLRYFAALIEREIGIVYSEVNHYQLQGRLEEIAKQLGYKEPLEMWNKVQKDGGPAAPVKQLLLDAATNNETSFFRDPNVFKAIEEVVTKAVSATPGAFTPAAPFRVWSAACSTGQEIYSLAMMFAELKDRVPFAYSIDATDFSERVLRRAETGAYTDLEAHRGLTPLQVDRFLNREPVAGNEREGPMAWVVKPELKRGMSFKKLNLLEPWHGMGNYHLILCRNVLIYQTVENKKKVVTKLHQHMAPGGALILGGAESLIGIFDELVYQTVSGTVVYRKREDGALRAAG